MEKKELMKLIGDNVRRYRMERNLTQDELAFKVDKGTSTISRIEGGQRMMSVPLMRKVAAALDVSCDALLWDDKKSVVRENIIRMLSGQSAASLVKLEAVIYALIQEYGEKEDNSCQS